jgi:hypothetical protein
MTFVETISGFAQVFARLDTLSVEQLPITFFIAITSTCCSKVVGAHRC